MHDNCDRVLAFGQTRPTMAKPVAELLGDLSGQALLSMPPDQLAIGRASQPTVVARKLDYLKERCLPGSSMRTGCIGRPWRRSL